MCRKISMVWLVLLLSIATNGWGEDDLTQAVLRHTAEDYKVFQKSVEETEENLDKISDTLAQAEILLRSQKIDPHLTKKLAEVREALVKERETFGRFSDFSKKTVNGLDVYLKADQIISNARERSGGPLARNLQVLATLMEECSDKLPVPLLRDAIKFYGQATTKLLDATDQINSTVKRNWEQGIFAIKTGIRNSVDDQRYQAFMRDFGSEAARGLMLAPQETAFVCQNDLNTKDPIRYVWDGDKWHKIDNDQLNVHQAMIDSLLAGDRVDAERLLHMASHAEFYNRRRQSSLEIYEFIAALKRGVTFDTTYRPIYRAHLESNEWISDAVRNPEAFVALYRCNENFSIQLNQALIKVYKDLKQVNDPTLKDLAKRIRTLENWAQTAHLDLNGGVKTARSEDQAGLPETPVMPEHLSRPEIEQWRDKTIARLRQEGNARLDRIREALQKMEGKNIEQTCPKCGHGGPHWWDGHGWTCSSCGATVMTVGDYPTAGGSYKKTREHYLSLIQQVQQQADAEL